MLNSGRGIARTGGSCSPGDLVMNEVVVTLMLPGKCWAGSHGLAGRRVASRPPHVYQADCLAAPNR